MLTRLLRTRKIETVNIVIFSPQLAIPGETIPETVTQSGISCVLTEATTGTGEHAPVLQGAGELYRCYQFTGTLPAIGQILRRENGECFTILTQPKRYKNLIYFNCQKGGKP